MSKPTEQEKSNRLPKENPLTEYLVTESAREGGIPDAATREQLAVLMSAPELVTEPEPKRSKTSRKRRPKTQPKRKAAKRKSGASRKPKRAPRSPKKTKNTKRR